MFIFAFQADQSGTVAEVLLEDGKPVSVDTVTTLSLSLSLSLSHTHTHTQPYTHRSTYTKISYLIPIYEFPFFILAASFCDCTVSYFQGPPTNVLVIVALSSISFIFQNLVMSLLLCNFNLIMVMFH